MEGDGWCRIVVLDGRPLNDIAGELGIVEGMPVVLFYADPAEEFEYDGTISHRQGRWWGRAKLDTYRLLRDTPVDEATWKLFPGG
jgi:hypothetical protein